MRTSTVFLALVAALLVLSACSAVLEVRVEVAPTRGGPPSVLEDVTPAAATPTAATAIAFVSEGVANHPNVPTAPPAGVASGQTANGRATPTAPPPSPTIPPLHSPCPYTDAVPWAGERLAVAGGARVADSAPGQAVIGFLRAVVSGDVKGALARWELRQEDQPPTYAEAMCGLVSEWATGEVRFVVGDVSYSGWVAPGDYGSLDASDPRVEHALVHVCVDDLPGAFALGRVDGQWWIEGYMTP